MKATPLDQNSRRGSFPAAKFLILFDSSASLHLAGNSESFESQCQIPFKALKKDSWKLSSSCRNRRTDPEKRQSARCRSSETQVRPRSSEYSSLSEISITRTSERLVWERSRGIVYGVCVNETLGAERALLRISSLYLLQTASEASCWSSSSRRRLRLMSFWAKLVRVKMYYSALCAVILPVFFNTFHHVQLCILTFVHKIKENGFITTQTPMQRGGKVRVY